MSNAWRRLAGGLAAGSMILAGLAAPPAVLAAGATIVVTSMSDPDLIGDGTCSLREAITSANSNAGNTNDDCTDGTLLEDMIVFAQPGTILLSSNLPAITDQLTIEGGDRVTIDGHFSYTPISSIADGLEVRDIRIENGFGAFGGAITNGGYMTLRRVTVRSSGANYGGGIHNNGTMLIYQSTIEGNTANNAGGGIFNEDEVHLTNVTVAGNTAPDGGGFYQSTGAGVIWHVTIARNTATTGAGMHVAGGSANPFNSLIVNNSGPETDGSVTPTYSLVQNSGTGVIDPDGLNYNGGPTRTIRLLGGANPALSIGDPDYCDAAGYVDQRGYPRPTGDFDKCDAGAFQLDRTKPTMSTARVQFRTGASLNGTSSRAIVSFTGTDTGSGIQHFSIQRQVNGGSWLWISISIPPVQLTSAGGPVSIAGYKEASGSRRFSLSKDKSYRFRVRAVDEDGNFSAWRYTPTVTARLFQQTNASMSYTSGWSTASSTKFSGGSVRYVRANGKAAALTFTGRAVAFVTTLRAGGTGQVKIYVDGVYRGTKTLSAAVSTYRSQVFQYRFASSASHKIKIVTVGSGRVDIDAFAVLR